MEQVVSGAAPRLQEFLRMRRGDGAQRAVAAAANISLRRYKRLENGEAGTIGLDALLRVCEFLGLNRSEELEFLELARPDLGFALSGRNLPTSARHWRSLHKVASRLRQAKGPRDAQRTAVEILHASFGPELAAFAGERHPRQALRIVCVIGRPVDATNLLRALDQRNFGDRRVAYAPMYRDGATFGGIGLASIGGADLPRASLEFLLMVAALLETQLNNRAMAGLPECIP
jgi:transcriptional regulator with XRE-family HTH domain